MYYGNYILWQLDWSAHTSSSSCGNAGLRAEHHLGEPSPPSPSGRKRPVAIGGLGRDDRRSPAVPDQAGVVCLRGASGRLPQAGAPFRGERRVTLNLTHEIRTYRGEIWLDCVPMLVYRKFSIPKLDDADPDFDESRQSTGTSIGRRDDARTSCPALAGSRGPDALHKYKKTERILH